MQWGKRVLRRFRAVGRIEGFECEIKAELLFHVDMRTQDNIASGMTPEEAMKDALRRFGDFEKFNRLCREAKQASRATRLAKAINPVTIPLAAIGFVITRCSVPPEVHQIGQLLIVIAVLLRLFVYVRTHRFAPRYVLSERQGGSLLRGDG